MMKNQTENLELKNKITELKKKITRGVQQETQAGRRINKLT